MAHDRNAYLIKNYGITAVRYAEMAMEQGNACKCCGQIPTGRPLHVDHCHKLAKTKFKVKLVEPKRWQVVVLGQTFESKISYLDLRDFVRQWLLASSVRGLLCWQCNSALRALKNSAENCRSAGRYLDAFTTKCYSVTP